MAEDKKPTINYRQICSPEIRKIDVEERVIEFVASDSSIDSFKTVLPVNKWSLTRYEKNGVVGYMHELYGDSIIKSADPDDVIGIGRAWVEDGQLIISIKFEPADLNEKADKIFRKLRFGSLNAVSVGFVPTAPGHWGDERAGEDPDVYYYDGQELLEVSVVNIPANSNAVRRSIAQELEEHPKPAPAPEQPDTRQADEVELKKKKLLTATGAALRLAQFNNKNA